MKLHNLMQGRLVAALFLSILFIGGSAFAGQPSKVVNTSKALITFIACNDLSGDCDKIQLKPGESYNLQSRTSHLRFDHSNYREGSFRII